jgi:hypothetical protein
MIQRSSADLSSSLVLFRLLHLLPLPLLFPLLPRLRIRRPNVLGGFGDHLAIRLERSDAERLLDAKKRALEALDGGLRAADLVRARAHRGEPPDELDAGALGAAQREHERLLARTHGRGRVLGLRARRRRARDEVERELAARVAGLLERLAHGRRGHALAAVLAALGEQPLVAHVVAQEADLERGAGRGEEDGAAADEEVGGWELVGGVFGQRHGLRHFVVLC